MKSENTGHTTVTIPLRMKNKFIRIKKEFTTEKLGCKIPTGVIAVQAMEYVVDKLNRGVVTMEFNKGAVKFKDCELLPEPAEELKNT